MAGGTHADGVDGGVNGFQTVDGWAAEHDHAALEPGVRPSAVGLLHQHRHLHEGGRPGDAIERVGRHADIGLAVVRQDGGPLFVLPDDELRSDLIVQLRSNDVNGY